MSDAAAIYVVGWDDATAIYRRRLPNRAPARPSGYARNEWWHLSRAERRRTLSR